MPSSFDLTILVPIIVVPLVSILKIRKALKGSKVNRTVIIVTSILFSIFASYLIYNSFLIGIPIIFLPLSIILFVSAQFFSYHYADRSLSFWKESDGSIYSRGALFIQIIFIISLVLRISVSIIFIGSASFYTQVEKYVQLVNQDPIILTSIIAADVLMISSAGMVLGLNRRLLRRYALIERGEETVKESK